MYRKQYFNLEEMTDAERVTALVSEGGCSRELAMAVLGETGLLKGDGTLDS